MRASPALAAAALAVAALVSLAAVPPGPAVVGGDAEAGVLRILPAVSRVEVAPGVGPQGEGVTHEGVTVAVRVENGADRAVTFVLDARGVVPGPDGAPTVADGTSGAASWVTFAATDITLEAGSTGDLRAAVNVPDGATLPAVVALVATADAGDRELVAYLAIDPAGGGADVSMSVDAARDGRQVTTLTTITNTGTASAIATVRVGTRAWYGARVVDVTSGPLLVLAGQTRAVANTFQAPLIPGPYDTEAVLTAADAVTRASTRSLLWNPAVSVMVVALALLVVTSAALLRARRRAWRDASAS